MVEATRQKFNDSYGRVIYYRKQFYFSGKHTLEVEGLSLNVQGVIYIKMKSEDDVLEHKMLKL